MTVDGQTRYRRVGADASTDCWIARARERRAADAVVLSLLVQSGLGSSGHTGSPLPRESERTLRPAFGDKQVLRGRRSPPAAPLLRAHCRLVSAWQRAPERGCRRQVTATNGHAALAAAIAQPECSSAAADRSFSSKPATSQMLIEALASMRMQKSASIATTAWRTVATPANAAITPGRALDPVAFTKSGAIAQDACSSSDREVTLIVTVLLATRQVHVAASRRTG